MRTPPPHALTPRRFSGFPRWKLILSPNRVPSPPLRRRRRRSLALSLVEGVSTSRGNPAYSAKWLATSNHRGPTHEVPHQRLDESRRRRRVVRSRRTPIGGDEEIAAQRVVVKRHGGGRDGRALALEGVDHVPESADEGAEFAERGDAASRRPAARLLGRASRESPDRGGRPTFPGIV